MPRLLSGTPALLLAPAAQHPAPDTWEGGQASQVLSLCSCQSPGRTPDNIVAPEPPSSLAKWR